MSNGKAFTTTASSHGIGVLEHEIGIDTLATEIDMGTFQQGKVLAIQYERYPFYLDLNISLAERMSQFNRVSIARTARTLGTKTYRQRIRFTLKEGEKALSSSGTEAQANG